MSALSSLLTSKGQKLVNALPPYSADDVGRLSKELRERGYDAEMVGAALTMSRLRDRARSKFGEEALELFLTEDGLQQATRSAVAELHAQRYVEAGCRSVVDLTSGIGADAMAFARAGLRVVANDLDPVTAGFAALNLQQFEGVKVVNRDALELGLSDFDGVFVDPARRNARGRTFNPADYSPPFEQVLAIRETVPALGVKVAPGIAYENLPADVHAQWISMEGDVVEAGLWFGPLAEVGPVRGPGRSALVMKGMEIVEVEATNDPRAPVIPMDSKPLGHYFYEPDGAVIRAGAVRTVAQILQAAPVSDRIAYLSGDKYVETSLATAFEVIDAMTVKQVRGYLAQRNVGSLEILKRGYDVDPDLFRKKLKLKGPNSATVVLTRLQGRHMAVVVRRIK